MKLSWKTGVALVIGGILLGGSLSAVSQTGDRPDDRDKRERMRGPGGPGGRPPLLGRLVRSEALVQGEEDGTFNTIKIDGGILESVDGDTLVIDQADGETVRVPTDDDTGIRRDRERAGVGDLEAGDHVVAHQVKEGDADFVTKRVMAISAERYAEMEAQREACTDDDQSTECERRSRRGPGGPRGPRGQGDDVEPTADEAFFEDAA